AASENAVALDQVWRGLVQKSINGWSFARGTPLAEVARQVKDAGFEAFEPAIELEGELAIDSTESACRRIGEQIRAAGLNVASLACGLFWQASYTSPDL